MKRLVILFIFVSMCTGIACAELRFSDLALSKNDTLLFRASVDSPGYGSYDTLFLSDLKKSSLKQLTFFPERVVFLKDKKILQIQNRFGVFRTDSELKSIQPIDTFPSFVTDSRVESGKLIPIQISPNGQYLLYMKQTSAAFGSLVLFDLQNAEETVISKKIEMSLKSAPAIWSSDSSFLIYCKEGSLYYFSLSQIKEKRLIAEEYRRIGEGQISNVRWGKGSSLYYISGSLIYRLDSRELFTRALYSGYLKIGRIRGKIPFNFDSNFDSFWISPDGRNILLNKGGRNIFLYILSSEDFLSIGDSQSLPYLYLPRNTRIKEIFWTASGTITVLSESIKRGKNHTAAFRLKISGNSINTSFKPIIDDEVLGFVLSPDEEIMAVIKTDRVILKNYETWVTKEEHHHPEPHHVLWASEDEIIVAGAYISEIWNIKSGSTRVITISQPDQFGFSEHEDRILLKTKELSFSTSSEACYWERISSFNKQEEEQTSELFRVYLELSTHIDYSNMVMIRDVRGFGTRPLLKLEDPQYEVYPTEDEPVDFVNFSHGSRIRQREVSLVFNAIDSIEGLTSIFNTLSEYNVRCTFFINGEVIRRYPDAVKEIAESGHEAGSLFYIHFNMTDSRFHLDKEFIKRGLARNEDDYFKITDRELSLLWHAPYYFINSELIEASKEMNYTHIGRDIDSLDWVTDSMSIMAPGIYLPSAQLVERIIDLKMPGSIIPIMVGTPDGERVDYLFQKLDILIDGLLKLGYSIVPVTTLIEHAK